MRLTQRPRPRLLWPAVTALLLLLIITCEAATSTAQGRAAATGAADTPAAAAPLPGAYSAAAAATSVSSKGKGSSGSSSSSSDESSRRARVRELSEEQEDAPSPPRGAGIGGQRAGPSSWSESGLAIDPAVVSSLPSASSILLVSVSLRGHVYPLANLASELARRGFKTAIAVHEDGRELVQAAAAATPAAAGSGVGIRFHSLGRLPYSKSDRGDRLKHICHDTSLFRGALSLLSDIYLPNSLPMYKSLHALVARERPTLMIIDSATLGAIDVAHKFNIPYIINHPSIPVRLEHQPHFLDALASPIPSPHQASLWSRAASYLYPRLLTVALTPVLMEVNRARWSHELPLFHSPQHVHEGIPTQLDSLSAPSPSVRGAEWSEADDRNERHLREHVTLLPPQSSSSAAVSLAPPSHASCVPAFPGPVATLINTAFGAVEYAYPLPQSVHLTGPLMQHNAPRGGVSDLTASDEGAAVTPPPPMSSATASALSWLSQSSKSAVVVLFGAGTMSYIDTWQVLHLAGGLTDSRFRVLWALRSDGRAAIPTPLPHSFRIKSNFEQIHVIAHEHVRLVIAPCGSATVHESLYYGKPLLCIPLLAEQSALADRVVAAGAGLSLEKWSMEVSDISKHVLHLVRNHTFRANAKRLGKILRAAGGTAEAADVVAEAIHRAKFDLLTQPTQLQCWHQLYQLDLIAVVIAVGILAILAVRTLGLLLLAAVEAARRPLPIESDATGSASPSWRRPLHALAHLLRRSHASSSSSTVASTQQLSGHLAVPAYPQSSADASLTLAANMAHAAAHVNGVAIGGENGSNGRPRAVSTDSTDSQRSESSTDASEEDGGISAERRRRRK